MQAVEAELDALREQIQKADNILERATIVAPVGGTIVPMFVLAHDRRGHSSKAASPSSNSGQWRGWKG
jgi:hypothetical protein